MPTSPVVSVVSGASFSVNTTAANLDPVLTVRDFVVLENGTLTLNPLSYTKSTPTTINYSGPSLAANTSLELRRSTPRDQRTLVLPNTKVRASDWNAEFDRRVRIQEEVDLYGAGGGFTVRLPVNGVYDIAWSTDTLFSPTRQTLYNKIETLAPLASPTFTGNPVAPTQLTSDNSTRVATTAYVKSNIGAQAPLASPAFTGVPTVPTPLTSDNSTTIASTAYVKANVTGLAPLANPVFTGNPVAPTALTTDNSTSIATTAHVKANLANYTTTTLLNTNFAPLVSPTFTGTPAVPTALAGTNTTQVASTAHVMQRSKPCLIASRITSTQALAVTVENPIVWNNAIRDVDGMLNTSTGVITLPRVGYYSISALAFYSGTATLGSLTVIEGGTLTRIARMDFRGNTASAIVLSGTIVLYASAINTQIRLSVHALDVAGSLTNESTTTSRSNAHMSVHYLGVD
jgi:hypothetical protein